MSFLNWSNNKKVNKKCHQIGKEWKPLVFPQMWPLCTLRFFDEEMEVWETSGRWDYPQTQMARVRFFSLKPKKKAWKAWGKAMVLGSSTLVIGEWVWIRSDLVTGRTFSHSWPWGSQGFFHQSMKERTGSAGAICLCDPTQTTYCTATLLSLLSKLLSDTEQQVTFRALSKSPSIHLCLRSHKRNRAEVGWSYQTQVELALPRGQSERCGWEGQCTGQHELAATKFYSSKDSAYYNEKRVVGALRLPKWQPYSATQSRGAPWSQGMEDKPSPPHIFPPSTHTHIHTCS